ncbi:MAG: hypothetical protein AABP62_00360 [Planctomycetota bacterium]
MDLNPAPIHIETIRRTIHPDDSFPNPQPANTAVEAYATVFGFPTKLWTKQGSYKDAASRMVPQWPTTI